MAEYALNLRDYWRILRKRKAIVIFTTVMLGAFSFGFATMQKPVPRYSASAAVKIEKSATLAGLYLETLTWSGEDRLETQATIIRSYPIMEKVAMRLGYIDTTLTSEQIRQDDRLLSIVLGLKGQISTQQEGYTNIINITATSFDPDEAQRLANAVAEVYKEENTREKNKRIHEARAFIERQLFKKRSELHKAEEAVRKFRETHELVSISSQTSTVLSQLTKAKSDYDRLDKTIGEISMMIDQLKRREALPREAVEGLFADQVSGVFYGLNSRLTNLKLRRTTLLEIYTENHPEVKQIDAEIEKVTESMIAELVAQKRTLEKRRDIVVKELEKHNAEFKSLPQEALTLERLEREVKVIGEVVAFLESKYQEALIKESEKVEEVSIVRPALRPRYPINPPKTRATTFAGVVMGLILGLVFAFVAETLDTSIGTIEDVEKYLGVPVLGIIPHVGVEEIKETLLGESAKKDDREVLEMKAHLVAHFAPKSTLAESYRALRTNIQFAGLEQGIKTLLFSSSSNQEGKTTVSTNLAITMAQAGNKTLLVDGDLRRPIISRIFGIDRSPGFSEVILGNYQWRETVRTVTDIMMGRIEMEDLLATPGIDNLNIITSGTIPPNPTELLNFRKTEEFTAQVREEYDMVIFDSAPVLPVTDAAILGSKVDGVVLVYQVGKIGRGALKRAKVQMDNVKAKVIGVVLNGLRPEVSPDFHDYKYYGRYYTYGREERELPRWRRLFRLPRALRRSSVGKAAAEGVEEAAVWMAALGLFRRLFRRGRGPEAETAGGRSKLLWWLMGGLILVLLTLGGGFLWQRGHLRFKAPELLEQGVEKQGVSRPGRVSEPKRPGIVGPAAPETSAQKPDKEGVPPREVEAPAEVERAPSRAVKVVPGREVQAPPVVKKVPPSRPAEEVSVKAPEHVEEGAPVEAPVPVEKGVRAALSEEEAIPAVEVGIRRPYAVHLASYRYLSLANQEADLLREAGYDALVTPVDLPGKGLWYRVLVGGFRTEAEAEKVADQLRGAGKARYAEVLELPYTVFVDSFRSKRAAVRREGGLRIKGFPPYFIRVRTSEGQIEYRLMVGAFATRDEAQATAGRLKAVGISSGVTLR
ncbi:MAG TPA: polysaccharide biosynthesis tyrosine autokinase [Candidatus Latescibacteria bacterium]|nr:polysaccharide biosynthesis tyrosine autokinase [Candidatus Latescibacterota bacterium]